MQKRKYTFQKSERIVSKKIIESLQQKGENIFVYPLKVKFLHIEKTIDDISVKVLISVPKKNFKKAVYRNRIKRLIREAYRLNKHTLTSSVNKQLNIHFHYVSKNILSFEQIEQSIQQILILLANI